MVSVPPENVTAPLGPQPRNRSGAAGAIGRSADGRPAPYRARRSPGRGSAPRAPPGLDAAVSAELPHQSSFRGRRNRFLRDKPPRTDAKAFLSLPAAPPSARWQR